jgi:hypothetical protein
MKVIFNGVLLVGCVVLLASSVASAQLTKIEIVFAMGLTSDFDADGGSGSNGLQTLQSTNGAYVYTDDIYAPPISFSTSDILATFEDTTDTSSGGVASAEFGSGVLQLQLFDSGDNVVMDMSATVDWYDELETADNAVDGRGILTLGSVTLGGELLGHEWASTNGKSGLLTSIVNAQPQPLTSYLTDWSSNNVMLMLYADSSVIPEPATIMLLGLGAVVLARRRS